MVLFRQIAAEVTKALVVLALVFLSFAHQPVALAGDEGDILGNPQVALSFCGGAPDDDGNASHVPCHACRFDLAPLPQPPCVASPAYASYVALAVLLDDAPVIFGRAYRSDFPRAPPAAV